jgi:hypothetical protein
MNRYSSQTDKIDLESQKAWDRTVIIANYKSGKLTYWEAWRDLYNIGCRGRELVIDAAR